MVSGDSTFDLGGPKGLLPECRYGLGQDPAGNSGILGLCKNIGAVTTIRCHHCSRSGLGPNQERRLHTGFPGSSKTWLLPVMLLGTSFE